MTDITGQDTRHIHITHSNWLKNFNVDDLFYDYVVGKVEIEGIGTVGGHITFLNLGEQALTSEESPEIISKFNSLEMAFGLSYGTKVTENLAIGTSLRYILSSLAGGTAVGEQKVNPGSSVALDLSMLYRTNPFLIGQNEARFSFGTNLSNIGPGIQYTDNAQKDPLPTILRFGFAFDYDLDPEGFNRITVATDVSKIMARTKQKITTNVTVEAF